MNKTIQSFAIIILMIFAFFAGVNYADSVKNHASWLFEQKEEEVELPDLSEEPVQENEVIQEGQEMIDATQPIDNNVPAGQPVDNVPSNQINQE